MRIVVHRAFVSRKTAISWAAGGMEKGNDREWLEGLRAAVQPHRQKLLQAFAARERLSLEVTIYGAESRVRPLDIHDALAQVVDQLVDAVLPREKARPIPQTADRHFWSVSAQKVVNEHPRVQISITREEQKTRSRPKRSTTELRDIWEHLVYEIQMLGETGRTLSTFKADPANDRDRVIQNALIESFTVHARSLIAFLYANYPRTDDVIADDFFDNPEAWHDKRPPISELLETVHPRVGREIAHLTYARAGIISEQRQWPFARIAAEVIAALKVLEGLLPRNLITPNVQEIWPAAEVPTGITDVASKGGPGSGANPS